MRAFKCCFCFMISPLSIQLDLATGQQWDHKNRAPLRKIPPPHEDGLEDEIAGASDEWRRWPWAGPGELELWIRGSTLTWTLNQHVRKVLRVDDRILSAFPCRFYDYPHRPSMTLAAHWDEGLDNLGSCHEALTILQEGLLRVFGVLIERDVNVGGLALPTWFALLHPLEDLSRVVTKLKGQLKEVTNDSHQVILVESEPSLCLTFHKYSGQHYLWHMRGASADEISVAESTTFFQGRDRTSISGFQGPQHHTANPSRHHSSTSHRMDSCPQSPFGTSRTPTSSGYSQSSSAASSARNTPIPLPMNSLASIVRSPCSPKSSIIGRSQLQQSTLMGSLPRRRFQQTPGVTLREDPGVQDSHVVSLDVSLCLDHAWTEPPSIAKQNKGRPASHAFLATDTLQDQYLCYLQTHLEKLAMIRIERRASDDELAFGAVNHIPALDAAPIPALDMILILDQNRSMSLYSGQIKVSKVMFDYCPQTSRALPQLARIAHEISSLNLDSQPGTPVSLMTSSRPPSTSSTPVPSEFNESISTLSPVLPEGPTKVVHLKDPVHNHVTLVCQTGQQLRMELPSNSYCPIVQRCLESVSGCLPRDWAVKLQAKWFATRNAPGPTSMNPSKEWKLFAHCLLGSMGYQTSHFTLFPIDQDFDSLSPTLSVGVAHKKVRLMDQGSDGDWDFLLRSEHHQESGQQLSFLLGMDPVSRSENRDLPPDRFDGLMDMSADFFGHLPHIVLALHLLYEELKVSKEFADVLPYLAGLLVRLTADLRLSSYVRLYWSDYPQICPESLIEAQTRQMDSVRWKKLQPFSLPPSPPNIFILWRQLALEPNFTGNSDPLFPLLQGQMAKLTLIVSILMDNQTCANAILHMMAKKGKKNKSPLSGLLTQLKNTSFERIREPLQFLELLCKLGFDNNTLNTLPECISIPLRAYITQCKLSLPPTASKEGCLILGRNDVLARVNDAKTRPKRPAQEEVQALCWSEDHRLSDAEAMLDSENPIPITVTQKPDISDHEFVEEQERCLYAKCIRTMALPVGRAAFALNTTNAVMSEPVEIPTLCLSGRAPPRGSAVEMDHIETVPNMERWPMFHNGVAAGLAVDTLKVDATWITFNKPHDMVSVNGVIDMTQHAGFLYALGLSGTLSKLGKLDSYDYMMKGNEMISIGILLGMAASKKGSKDLIVTKKISTQLTALLPPSATELPLSHATQIAALLSLGLVYMGTGHRYIAEVCLRELGRPHGPDLENCSDRESYSLSAGLALGMVTLGQGSGLMSGPLADLQLADSLHHFMIGGPKSAVADKFRTTNVSQTLQFGDNINMDISGPGATLALGLMFFDSGNHAIANWMEAPESQFLLEFVRPDFLMLRTLAKGLILWSEITPSLDWIENHVPKAILPFCMVRPVDNHPSHVDYETINQAYCNIITGAALIMGIRFAGTCNQQAFEVLFDQTRRLVAISKRTIAELAGRATIEQCICVHVLALAIVMAGSGELEILRLIRYLRSRVGTKHPTVTYGSHMALHLALGLLFLSEGTMTLKTSPEAVAAMVCAFYPKFPTHSNDNRYHLQALRHLYVLATERRLLLPQDVTTGEAVYARFLVKYKDTEWYPGFETLQRAPILLPELKNIQSIQLQDDRYFTLEFDEDHISLLESVLKDNFGRLPIKQRAGCLSHVEDPLGFKSIAAQCLSMDPSFQWHSAGSTLLKTFSSDPKVKSFLQLLISPQGQSTHHQGHQDMKKLLVSLLYECCSHEKMELLPAWLELYRTAVSPDKSLFGPTMSNFLLFIDIAKYCRLSLVPEVVVSWQQKNARNLNALFQKAHGPSAFLQEKVSRYSFQFSQVNDKNPLKV
eukprot:TCALIF_04317-PA protein Name:"Similar to Anapc1 Anaphase-promoting complex subunit 1 (Mus musculus)" AED:0.04 eAED:0.05 QI:0/0.77/0.5/0.9/0.66/0.7/10/0/1830